MKKTFPIEEVLTVYTGVCMKAGVGCAQEVFAHLYPGIMTFGCGAMQPAAAREIERQHHWLADLPLPAEWNADVAVAYSRLAAGTHESETMEIDGPIRDAGPTGIRLEIDELGRILGKAP